MPRAALPKVLPPRLGRVVRRPRVAQALLAATERGAAWVQAPGGWGKTTAVAALAEDLKHPVVWLHVDESDSEPLAFFHFLRLATARALPKSERALPVFAKELAADPSRFARRFARAAIESAPATGATLVLDNLQDAQDGSPVHGFVATLAEELAPAWKVFLVTRAEPAAAYLKLLGQGRLEVPSPETFAFTEAELRHAMRERGILDERRLERLAKQSGGWIAGALLLAMRGGDEAPSGRSAGKEPEAVFNYFATQALANRAADDRRLLERTAFLSTISTEAAGRLSGLDDCGRRLERFSRDGLFTTKLEGQPPRYRYHDLFRDYLRAEARTRLAAPDLRSSMQSSAVESLASGETLHGLELLADCGAWQEFAAAAVQGARGLLRRGQYVRFAGLLRSMPAGALDADPWLRYWLGQCELHMSDDAAAVELARAYEAFEKRGDRPGQLLCAIEMPLGVRNRSGNWAEESLWTGRVEALADAAEALAPADLSLKVYAGLLSVVKGSRALDPRTEEFSRRIFELIPRVEDDPNLRLRALSPVVLAAWRTRRPDLGPPAIKLAAELDLEHGASSLTVLHWLFDAITYDTIFGDPARALANAERAAALARAIGLPTAVADSMYLRLEVACDANDLPSARTLHAQLEAMLDPGRPIGRLSFEGFAGRIALLEGDATRALEASRRAREVMDRHGGKSLGMFSMAAIEVSAFAMLGRYEDARKRAGELAEHLHRYDTRALQTSLAWARAAEALDRGEASARELLAAAVAEARSLRDFLPLRHANKLAARLCARALEWGIDPDFIRTVVARRGLVPPDDAPAAWPWALRVRTLGGVELARRGEPVAERGRAQKSLELLELAIALGGEQVPVERLVKTLWPGEGREGAQQAFDTTLHRLRKLVGADDALRVADRRLTIDTDLAWVDALVLQRRLKALEDAGGGSNEDWRSLVALYQGHFLPHRTGEAWADEARERLWGGTRRLLLGAARKSRVYGDAPLAERLLYFVMDLDPQAEDAVGELMRLHLDRGEAAEALRVFRRCEAALAAELKVAPGRELKALAERARGKEVSQL
jgi:ATP/maltotriose-dependent transcriptional regulator MalT/DNA-binding SARP family transcriptional activator